jgi:GNAT superfamily N-acetyltransferase
MPFATWWRGDPLPELPSLPDFSARRSTDLALLRRLTGLSESVLAARFDAGHEIFLALVADEPAGYGWLARRSGGIEELDYSFDLPDGDGYLWDFVTLPAWRGQGVYPHLLQAIVRQEPGVERFWIGYEANNQASARGIQKAGFLVIGDLALTDRHVSGFVVARPGERAEAAVAIFEPRAQR